MSWYFLTICPPKKNSKRNHSIFSVFEKSLTAQHSLNNDQKHGLQTNEHKRSCQKFPAILMSFPGHEICIEENNSSQPASPRWNTSVIYLWPPPTHTHGHTPSPPPALLLRVLSLGSQVAVPQKADVPRLRGAGAVEGDGQPHGHPDRACTEHMHQFSSAAPTHTFP